MTKPSSATSRPPSKAQVKAAELWLLEIGEDQARMVKAGWQAALAATKAAGLLILIELAGALGAIAIWLAAVLT